MSTFQQPSTLPVTEQLEEGLLNLRAAGWTQHDYKDSVGACCSLGALHSEYDAAVDLLARAVRESGWIPTELDGDAPDLPFWSGPSVVICWNDEPGRTFEQVEAMWETAIKLAKSSH